MTRAQQEILVERYLAGEMAAAEEQEFFMRVATDAELLGTLRAHRMVDRALSRDREALPSGYMFVQERALAMLAAQPAVATAVLESNRGWFGRSRFTTLVVFISTAVIFALGGFAIRELIETPSPELARQIQPVTPLQQPASPGLSTADSVRTAAPIADATQSTTPAANEVSRATRITDPATANPSRSGREILRASKSDTGGKHLQNNGATATRNSSRVEPRRDTLSISPAVRFEEEPSLPRGRDSITFKMNLSLPKKPNQKNQ